MKELKSRGQGLRSAFLLGKRGGGGGEKIGEDGNFTHSELVFWINGQLRH
jgi:hypothetical protein